jgi:hypothetical protein
MVRMAMGCGLLGERAGRRHRAEAGGQPDHPGGEHEIRADRAAEPTGGFAPPLERRGQDQAVDRRKAEKGDHQRDLEQQEAAVVGRDQGGGRPQLQRRQHDPGEHEADHGQGRSARERPQQDQRLVARQAPQSEQQRAKAPTHQAAHRS